MFNRNEFKKLIEKAKGDRSISEYARESGVSRTYISQAINKSLDNPPNPKILRELAKTAQNQVTYQSLMQAAGYLEGVQIENSLNKNISKIKEALSDDPELMEFWDELHNREDLKMMFKQTKDLSPKTIRRVIEIIKVFEEEEEERHGG